MMKMVKETVFDGKQAEIGVALYMDPQKPAILCNVEYENGYVDDVILSANPEIKLPKGTVVVKDYSEREMFGYVQFLIDNDIIHPELVGSILLG